MNGPAPIIVSGHRFAISLADRPAPIGAVRDRAAHLFVSVRNRAFDTGLLRAYCHLVRDNFPAGGCITVVDEPYRHNIAALATDPAERARALAGLERLSAERRRQCEKRIRGDSGGSVTLVDWRALAAAVPEAIRAECEAAFRQDPEIAALMREQAALAAAHYGRPDAAEAFLPFLEEELPVLLHSYHKGPVLDVYPGPQLRIIWEIDSGRFDDRLPTLAGMRGAAGRHAYAMVERAAAAAMESASVSPAQGL
ncbi:MAG: hypothetical protein ACPGID_10475 [Rubricella sp.]